MKAEGSRTEGRGVCCKYLDICNGLDVSITFSFFFFDQIVAILSHRQFIEVSIDQQWSGHKVVDSCNIKTMKGFKN